MASMVNVNTLRNMSEMSDIISELRDMTDDLTVHGAAPYGRLSQVSADNLTEEEFLALVLGPRRQVLLHMLQVLGQVLLQFCWRQVLLQVLLQGRT